MSENVNPCPHCKQLPVLEKVPVPGCFPVYRYACRNPECPVHPVAYVRQVRKMAAEAWNDQKFEGRK